MNTQQKQQIDWKRINKFLFQEGRRRSKTTAEIREVQEKLSHLSMACGVFSNNRRMLQRIGSGLLGEEVSLVAPACPDYSHQDGRYTFRSLSGGVSLLTERHISFLKEIVGSLAPLKVMMLVADHEADDPALCRSVGKSRNEFLHLVRESVKSTQEVIRSLGWTARNMTEAIPDLVDREKEISHWISCQEDFQSRIITETVQRSDMYVRINPAFTQEEMTSRTIATAAQYVAMGRWAAGNGHIICNHTTINLTWYLQTEAAVLHNPVSVY